MAQRRAQTTGRAWWVAGWVAAAAPLMACGSGTDARGRLVTVHVEHPAVWQAGPAAGVAVTLTAGGASRTVPTDAAGEARFDGVEGPADVSAVRAYAAEETDALAGYAAPYEATATGRTDGDRLALVLDGPVLGGLVIKEVAFTGAEAVGGTHYFHDQFIELFNNSTGPIPVAGLVVADAYGAAGEINPGTPPSPLASETAQVSVANAWRIPDSDARVLAPGESLIVAQDGTNHRPDSTVDLSGADYEAFNARNDMRDVDWPTVPNLEKVHFTGGFDWLMTVFGPSVVVARVPDTAALEVVPDPDDFQTVLRIPAAAVLDAVDILMDADSAAYKRLPGALDLGFTHASGTYTEESVRRVARTTASGRVVLQDTDKSSVDFALQSPPTPGVLR